MNEQNVEYLKNNIKYLGFSDSVFPELMKNMENRFPEFTLTHTRDYGNEKLEAKLHFSKSQTSDMYFANNYLATLTKSNQEKLSQLIYLEKGNGLTQKETYNLLSGRSVNTDLKNKEGEKYNAWIKLDFSVKEPNGNYKVNQFHEAYKYDLASTLQKYHINELKEDAQKERLIQSLQRGNKQQVTFEKNGVGEKLWIEANPQFKSLNIYDDQNRKVYIQKVAEKYGQSEEQKPVVRQSVVEENKQGPVLSQKAVKEKVNKDETSAPKEKQSKRVKQTQKS
jgi:hypothetical protein